MSGAIVVGDWVVAGTTPEDRDHGYIVSLDGEDATVQWSSCQWFSGRPLPCDLSRDDVEIYGSYTEAVRRHEELDVLDEVAS